MGENKGTTPPQNAYLAATHLTAAHLATAYFFAGFHAHLATANLAASLHIVKLITVDC